MSVRLRQFVESDSPAARSLRLLLAPLGLAYGGLMVLRSVAYRRGLLPAASAAVPVISIGNLTAGGTGKTPFTLMLCRQLKAQGQTPAILTRGYGALDPTQADEVRLFQRLLPDVPVYAHPDRVRMAEKATDDGATVLVLDDGFQHLRLRRDLDIVLIDAEVPWGGGLPLPAGLLREFPGALRRADLIAVTHVKPGSADAPASSQVQGLRDICPATPLLLTTHTPCRLQRLDGESLDIQALQGRRVLAFAGIARPQAFAITLRQLGADVVETAGFADHHDYSVGDLQALAERAAAVQAELITTEKDGVKLAALDTAAKAATALMLGVEIELLTGEALLRERLQEILQPPTAGDQDQSPIRP